MGSGKWVCFNPDDPPSPPEEEPKPHLYPVAFFHTTDLLCIVEVILMMPKLLGAIQNVSIDFGDGTAPVVESISAGSGREFYRLQHQYTSASTSTFRVIATVVESSQTSELTVYHLGAGNADRYAGGIFLEQGSLLGINWGDKGSPAGYCGRVPSEVAQLRRSGSFSLTVTSGTAPGCESGTALPSGSYIVYATSGPFCGPEASNSRQLSFPGSPLTVSSNGLGQLTLPSSLLRANDIGICVRPSFSSLYSNQIEVRVVTDEVLDFDYDGRVDISVYRPSTGEWFLHQSGDYGDRSTALGASTSIAVPADYDGDRFANEAVYEPGSGVWSIRGGTNVAYGGVVGDVPVPADYDGDGKGDVAIYRPLSGTWYVRRSSDGVTASATFGGLSGDIPVPSDYDSDGRADFAIFRSGVWYTHPSSGAADTAVGYGTSGDIPLPGDFDADGKADIAIFRPGTGLWAHQSTAGDVFVTYGGINGDVPVPADYDGDRKVDLAIYRPSSGAWFVLQSLTGATASATWGIPGDVPLELPYAVRHVFFP